MFSLFLENFRTWIFFFFGNEASKKYKNLDIKVLRIFKNENNY